jgi:hypothetical protein
MLNTSAWQEIDLRVLDQIHLDTENVRLDNEDAKVEADILADLFTNEGALDLVEGITKIGYLTHEIPVVVKRKNKYVVVEGNRRVAALKAMQNPMLVPAYQARIKTLTKGVPGLKALAIIRVKVAPNQEQANELIAALHTTNPRRSWSPARQAAFFQAQIDNGRTYAELRKRYPMIDVSEFVFRSHVLNLFRTAKYDDPELRDFVASKTWRRASSTIQRIYQAKEFLDLTGMAMDDKGTFTTTLSETQLTAVATTIVEGIKSGSLNTRTINTVKSTRFAALMTELRAALGLTSGASAGSGSPAAGGTGRGASSGTGTGGGGSATGTSGAGSASGSSGAGSGGSTKGRGTPKKQQFLVVPEVPANYSTALKRHYEELSTLDIQKMPNTAYLSMRAILEKSIKQFAESKGEEIKKTASSTGGYVQLHHAMVWYEKYLTTNGPKSLLQPLKRVRTGALANWGNYSSSKDALDAANHNHKYSVDPNEVGHLWDSIEPLLRELLKP